MSSKPENDSSNRISVVVVIGGAETPVEVNRRNKVESIVREALRESGNVGQPPDQWVLTLNGVNVDQAAKIDDTPITGGATLYLSPLRGEGG